MNSEVLAFESDYVARLGDPTRGAIIESRRNCVKIELGRDQRLLISRLRRSMSSPKISRSRSWKTTAAHLALPLLSHSETTLEN